MLKLLRSAEPASSLCSRSTATLSVDCCPLTINNMNEIERRRTFAIISHPDAGKTTLTQALKGEQIHYCKTQYIDYMDTIIDTPGEYMQVHGLGAALAIYSYEADVIGLVISANEPFCVFPPNCTAHVNRDVIGIISGIDKPDANVERVRRWLTLAGCKKIFPVSAVTGEGLADIIAFLEEPSDREKREKEKEEK